MQVGGPAVRRDAGVGRPVAHLGAGIVRGPLVDRQAGVYERRLGHSPFLGGKPASGVDQAAGICGLSGGDPGHVPCRGWLAGCGRGRSREPGQALLVRACRVRATGQRPPWRLCRGKPRNGPRVCGALPAWCLPCGRCRRRRGPGSSARGGCAAAVRRGRTSRRAAVTWCGHPPGVLGRPRVRMRCTRATCARVGVPAARADPAAEPSSKASQHDDKGILAGPPAPTPCSCRQPAAAVPPACPARLQPSGAVLWRGRPRQLVKRACAPCRYSCTPRARLRALLAEEL